jgi:hypothetical protein
LLHKQENYSKNLILSPEHCIKTKPNNKHNKILYETNKKWGNC